jgi:hypothetical protein
MKLRTFDRENISESRESGESSEAPMPLKEVSSSSGGGQVALDERVIANVVFRLLLSRYSLQEVCLSSIVGAGFFVPSNRRRLAS